MFDRVPNTPLRIFCFDKKMHTICSLLHITTNVKSAFTIQVIDINKMQFSFETFKTLRTAYFFVDLKNINIKLGMYWSEVALIHFFPAFPFVSPSKYLETKGRIKRKHSFFFLGFFHEHS